MISSDKCKCPVESTELVNINSQCSKALTPKYHPDDHNMSTPKVQRIKLGDMRLHSQRPSVTANMQAAESDPFVCADAAALAIVGGSDVTRLDEHLLQELQMAISRALILAATQGGRVSHICG